MINTVEANCSGLDMCATGTRISQLISESGLNDRQLGEIMNLSVQSINKWRHGRNLPDIENLFILSRILGTKVDDLLVPLPAQTYIVEKEAGQEPASMIHRLKEYMLQLKFSPLLNHRLNDKRVSRGYAENIRVSYLIKTTGGYDYDEDDIRICKQSAQKTERR